MKTFKFCLPFLLFMFTVYSGTSQTLITTSEVGGTWSRQKSPYYVLTNVSVPADSTLLIEAGVEIRFATEKSLEVFGSLQAFGTVSEKIRFTSTDTNEVIGDFTRGWAGISFIGDTSTENNLKYCVVEYICINNSYSPDGAITAKGRIVNIENCEIKDNKGDIRSGIYFTGAARGNLINNKIWNNFTAEGHSGGGIELASSHAVIAGNIIFNNRFGIRAYRCSNDTILILNNTIVHNGQNSFFSAGIDISNCVAKIRNNIIWQNLTLINYYSPANYFCQIKADKNEYLKIENCIIENGTEGIQHITGYLEANNILSDDPLFNGFLNHNFTLQNQSHAINAGKELCTKLEAIYNEDIFGFTRVFEQGAAKIDIGASEYQGIPANRTPQITCGNPIQLIPANEVQLPFRFYDPDVGNTHFLEVLTDNENIEIIQPAANIDGSNYTLKAMPGFTGQASVVLSVTDNYGLSDTDTFLITVTDTISNDILTNMHWNADTVYIDNSIKIGCSATLTIEAGTFVKFLNNSSITVSGNLVADGTPLEKIIFSSLEHSAWEQNTHTGWGGVILSNAKASNQLNHCNFEFVKNAPTLQILNSCSAQITNCKFSYNATSTDYNLPSTIYAEYAEVFIGNCLFNNNNSYSTVIYAERSVVNLLNCTFYENQSRISGTIYAYFGKSAVKNCIIWNNNPNNRAFYTYNSEEFHVFNTIVEGGLNSTGNIWAETMSMENIYGASPEFAAPEQGNFQLLQNSFAINTGAIDPLLSKINDLDYSGNPRIFDGTTDLPDLGIYEYQFDATNRKPSLVSFGDIDMMPGTDKNLTIEFADPDETDTHTITIFTDTSAIQTTEPSNNISGSTFVLATDVGYTGTSIVTVVVADNNGLADTSRFIVSVQNGTCGTIVNDFAWNADTIDITCDLLIEKGSTLTIGPGTIVRFNGDYKINVYGNILAMGTLADSVKFILHDSLLADGMQSSTYWESIYIHSVDGDTSEFTFCSFSGFNTHAIKSYFSSTRISNCKFFNYPPTENTQTRSVSAIKTEGRGKIIIENNLFENLSSTGSGAAIYAYSIFESLLIRNNTFKNNSARNAACVYSLMSKTSIENNLFENNTVTGIGGAVYIKNSGTVKENEFRNNSSTGNGGALFTTGNVNLISNQFIGNYSEGTGRDAGKGGAAYISQGQGRIANNLFQNNAATKGGAVCFINATYSASNNTFCKNSSEAQGSSIYMANSTIDLANNIMYGNRFDSVEIQNLYLYDNSRINFRNNLLEHGYNDISLYPYSSVSSIDQYDYNLEGNPFFADFTNNNFALTDSSLCVNQGTVDTSGLCLPVNDLNGQQRFHLGDVRRVDIGAYEYVGEPINRTPVISKTEDVKLFVNQTRDIPVKFADADLGDVHSISISSDNPDIQVEGLSGQVDGSTYILKSTSNWSGSGIITTIVADAAGKSDTALYTVEINNCVCGQLKENTIWDRDTIKVLCTVTVPDDITLTIVPGTVIEFHGRHSLKVQGSIMAQGTNTDSIVFTSCDTNIANSFYHWKGIHLQKPVSGNQKPSKLEYCKVDYSSGLFISNDSVEVSNSLFEHNYSSNGGGILITYCEPIITNSTFKNNLAQYTGGAISYLHNGELYKLKSPVISHCEFTNNKATYGGAIYIDEGNLTLNSCNTHHNFADYGGAYYFNNCENPLVSNNILYNNIADDHGGAIKFDASRALFINNTIVNNEAPVGGAIYGHAYSYPIFYNTIIYHNRVSEGFNQFYLNDRANPAFFNCNIQGGKEAFKGSGAGEEYKGYYVNNLDNNPYFVDTALNDFKLTDSSVCINTGTLNIKYGGNVPQKDYCDSTRLYITSETNVDMGAIEYQGSPLNRAPMVRAIADVYTSLNKSETVAVNYTDVDKNDSHTLYVWSSNPAVAVRNLSGNNSGSTFELDPVAGWEGSAQISVRVEDAGGRADTTIFNFIVSDSFCGRITGDVTWSLDTIKIPCTVTIEEHASLTIPEGTTLLFSNHAQLLVLGSLIAEGSHEKPILFTAADTSGFATDINAGWSGIRFLSGSSQSTIMKHCIVEYGVATLTDATQDAYGGGIYSNGYTNLEIANCTIRYNRAEWHGGGIYCNSGTVKIHHNYIHNNKGGMYGGGMYLTSYFFLYNLNDNVIANNTAQRGGGMYCNDLVSANNTIVNNQATSQGGGIYCFDGPLDFINTILWGNRASSSANQLYLSSHESVDFYHSVLEEGPDVLGTNGTSPADDYVNCTETNPLFVAATSTIGYAVDASSADWNFSAPSPCINAGSTIYGNNTLTLPSEDITGALRSQMDTVDMGAVEFINSSPLLKGSLADLQVNAGRDTSILIPFGLFFDGNHNDELIVTTASVQPTAWANFNSVALELSLEPEISDTGIFIFYAYATDLFGAISEADSFSIEVIKIDTSTTTHIDTSTSPISGKLNAIGRNKVQVYPVPANNYLTIDLSETKITNNTQIDIMNLSGTLVYSRNFQNEKLFDIDLQGIPSGFYILNIQNEHIKETIKFEKL